MKITKSRVVSFIRFKLAHDDSWAVRALLKIYAMQTADERIAVEARERNGVGFSKFDAAPLTAMVSQLQRGSKLEPYQLRALRHKISKYAGQIYAHSDADKLQRAFIKHYAYAPCGARP